MKSVSVWVVPMLSHNMVKIVFLVTSLLVFCRSKWTSEGTYLLQGSTVN